MVLRHSELTPAAYIDSAFQFPEVERVEIARFGNSSWEPAKVEELHPGFQADGIEQYLLERHGPARFRFSAIIGKKTFAWRVFTIGDVREEFGAKNGHDPNAVTSSQIERELGMSLKDATTRQQFMEFLSSRESASLERSLAPAKLLLEMFAIQRQSTPAAPTGPDPVTTLLLEELREARRELRESRTTAAPAATAPGNPVGRIAEDIKAVLSAAQLLGLSKPADGAAAPASGWTPDAIKTAIEAAAPVVNRVADLVQLRLVGGAAATNGAPAPALPTGASAMDKTPQLAPHVQENIGFFLESLRSRDFPTVLWMIENTFINDVGMPLVTIDPDVNPLAYVLKLKPLAPKIDELRGEVADFLKWIREQRDKAAAPPAGAK